MAAPRAPVVVLTDLDHAWAEVFVGEPQVPRIKLGQAATIFTDAGGAGIAGTVSYISPKAEFTPRNVQTADDRSKLVYRVKISADNRERRPQAGHAGRSRDPPAMTAASSAATDHRSPAADHRPPPHGPRAVARSRQQEIRRPVAIRDLSMSVERGEMFGLIGPDGAGKTTAIRLLCGLLRADSGDVRVLGRDPVKEHRQITHNVGYLSQRFSLYGDLTVDENIAFFAEIHGRRRLPGAPRPASSR